VSGISLAQLKLLSGLRFVLLAKHGPLLSWRVLGEITPGSSATLPLQDYGRIARHSLITNSFDPQLNEAFL